MSRPCVRPHVVEPFPSTFFFWPLGGWVGPKGCMRRLAKIAETASKQPGHWSAVVRRAWYERTFCACVCLYGAVCCMGVCRPLSCSCSCSLSLSLSLSLHLHLHLHLSISLAPALRELELRGEGLLVWLWVLVDIQYVWYVWYVPYVPYVLYISPWRTRDPPCCLGGCPVDRSVPCLSGQKAGRASWTGVHRPNWILAGWCLGKAAPTLHHSPLTTHLTPLITHHH
jgi:hypothetical protein